MSDMRSPWLRRSPTTPVTVLAHRGGLGPWRENTLAAFGGALRSGADGVELDVRQTADGALVVVHDPDIPGVGPVHALSQAELPRWVPTLVDALAVLSRAWVNVEIKNLPTEPGFDSGERMAVGVAALLSGGPGANDITEAGPAPSGPGTGPSPGHLVVSSFWAGSLAALASAPGMSADRMPGRGLLVHPSVDARAALGIAANLGCSALHPHHSQVDDDLVEAAHDMGMAVVTWTVNNVADIGRVVAAGVDAVITDQVEQTLVALGRR
jgi:glycerophosphoryl diester phosphodiesterase